MRRTFTEEVAYYDAKEVMPNVYVGTKNITTGYRIITGSESGYSSVIISHQQVDAIRKFLII
jgi:hypothetical protein